MRWVPFVVGRKVNVAISVYVRSLLKRSGPSCLLCWVLVGGFLLLLLCNVFDGDPAHYREPAQFRNAAI